VLLVALAAGFAWAHAGEREHEAEPAIARPDLYDTAVRAGNFRTLTRALDAARLTETVKGEGPFTVLAPNDEAFAKLPPGMLDSLLEPANTEKLARILTFHILPGRVPAAEVARRTLADTIQGTSVLIRTEDGKVFIDGAEVLTVDVPASNGVIHVIDRVILPKDLVETAVAARRLGTLLAAADAAGLLDTLKAPDKPWTLFAPTDEAFAALPAGTLDDLLKPENKDRLAMILKYHLVPGRMVLEAGKPETLAGPPLDIEVDEETFAVNGANVLIRNVKATNGVVHVIDRVLMPPAETPANEKAMRLIEGAIACGVPALDHEEPARCAAVYEAAVQSLLGAHTDALDERCRRRLNQALDEIKQEDNVRKRAWMLRQALDDVHGWLGEMKP
ncbi:MAG: fasciclin domain-containing protein, partial [Planctomycetota bacterium]|jgi:uncharacterized surface protein with fasciclin (FAS1) repeats